MSSEDLCAKSLKSYKLSVCAAFHAESVEQAVQLGKPFQSAPAKSAHINNHVAKEHVDEEVFLILLTDDNGEDAKTRFIIQSQSFS